MYFPMGATTATRRTRPGSMPGVAPAALAAVQLAASLETCATRLPGNLYLTLGIHHQYGILYPLRGKCTHGKLDINVEICGIFVDGKSTGNHPVLIWWFPKRKRTKHGTIITVSRRMFGIEMGGKRPLNGHMTQRKFIRWNITITNNGGYVCMSLNISQLNQPLKLLATLLFQSPLQG